jgi:trans-aconitate 2-methyltransferase
MLAKASKEHSDIIFKEGNFGAFHPEEKVDLLFANASLHWIKDHYSLFPQLVSTLNKGGYFAVQMPNNAHAPTHQSIIKILQANPAWHKFMEGLFFTELAQPMFSTTRYYDLLTAAGLVDLTLWETEYVQEMADHQAIYNWVSGSALRPILDKLNESEQQEFEQAYLELISKAYPTQANGKVLLPFRRFFVVGKVN